jgi:uncharacterized protein YjiS (DUF1127 family)
MSTLTSKAFPKAEVAASVREAVATALELLAAYRRARRERAQLLSLGERELHDIGITRLDALNAARQPLALRGWRRGGRS